MAKARRHQRTDFDMIQAQVMDDLPVVEAAFDRLVPRMLDQQLNGTHEERKDAELFFDVGTRLKKLDYRKKLIDEIFAEAVKLMEVSLSVRAGSKLTGEVYKNLLDILTEQFNFEPKFADKKLKEYLDSRKLTIDGGIPVAVEKARLVDDLRALPRTEGVLVTWKIPGSDCDAVVVVRTQGGPAKTPLEGTELIKGKLDNFIDRTAARGKKYFYSVFSVFEGKASTGCRACEGFRAPDPVSDLRARYQHPSVRLSWTAPEGCREVRIYRSERPITGIPIVEGRPVPPAGCNLVETTKGGSCADSGVSLGATYHYHAIADHGEGQLAEATSTDVTTPAPLPTPRSKTPSSQPGKISVEWQPATALPLTYRLFRRTSSGLPSLDDPPLYEGPDTRYDDRKVETGESYWYYVVACNEGLTSVPLRFGPIVAVNEVQTLDAQPGIRSVQLRWKAPPRVKQVIVRRREGSAPTSLTEGEEVRGSGAAGLIDKGVTPGKSYAYRIACVFHDADGREVTTPGLTTEKVEPFDAPPAPKDVKASINRGTVEIGWEPVRGGTVCVFRRDSDVHATAGGVVPVAELERGGTRLKLNDGRLVQDPFDAAQPWYVLASVLRGNLAVLHRRIHLVELALRSEKQDNTVTLHWPWLEGLERVRLTRRFLSPDGKDEMAERQLWEVDRDAGAAEGQATDEIADASQPHIRTYRIEPVNPPDAPLLLLNAAGERKLNLGPTTYVFYWIIPAKKVGWFTMSPAKLKIQLDRKVVNFPGVRLMAQSEDAEDEEDGEELLVWPEGSTKPKTVGPIEDEVDIPPLNTKERLFANLYLRGGNRPGLKVKPRQPSDKRQL